MQSVSVLPLPVSRVEVRLPACPLVSQSMCPPIYVSVYICPLLCITAHPSVCPWIPGCASIAQVTSFWWPPGQGVLRRFQQAEGLSGL